MATIATSTIKLTEHNYRSWKTYFKGRLMAKGLLHTIASGTVEQADSQKALGILIETLDPSQYRHVQDTYEARTAYGRLKQYHQPTTNIDRVEVSRDWAKLNWNTRQETLPDFIHRFQEMITRMSEVGNTESEEQRVVKLLALMPWEFRHIVDRLLNAATQPTMMEVKTQLESEWKAAIKSGAIKPPSGHANEDRALMSQGANNDGRGGRNSHDPTWDWDVRPIRQVLLHGEIFTVTFHSRRDLEIARLRRFIDDNDPTVPNWMTHPFLVTQYDMRAFHHRDLSDQANGAHYRPWLSPNAYISYPFLAGNAPWHTMYQRSLRRHQRAAQAALDAEATDADGTPPTAENEGSNAAMDVAANSATTQALGAMQNHIVVDSGASSHMTGASHHLHDTSPCDRRVVVANGKSSVATTMGKLNIKTPCGKTITLSDVLLIEGMPMTLMSIPALMNADPKVSVKFQKDTCIIYRGRTQVATASIMPDQRLYILKGTCDSDNDEPRTDTADTPSQPTKTESQTTSYFKSAFRRMSSTFDTGRRSDGIINDSQPPSTHSVPSAAPSATANTPKLIPHQQPRASDGPSQFGRTTSHDRSESPVYLQTPRVPPVSHYRTRSMSLPAVPDIITPASTTTTAPTRVSTRIRKPNPRFASLAAETLDADLEGYQSNDIHDADDTILYRPKMEILGTYVDDFIVAAPTQNKMDSIMEELASKMNLKRQGPLHYMLGVRVTRSTNHRELTMIQDAYTDK
ncbi:hypothetical protein DYB32_009011, partial [Aphanomyces invadans]